MPRPEPDYTIVERQWEERLRERGLPLDRFDFGIANLNRARV
jgi:hypothetical protein